VNLVVLGKISETGFTTGFMYLETSCSIFWFNGFNVDVNVMWVVFVLQCSDFWCLFDNRLLLCVCTRWGRYFAVSRWHCVSCFCSQSQHTAVCQNWENLDLYSSKMYDIYCLFTVINDHYLLPTSITTYLW